MRNKWVLKHHEGEAVRVWEYELSDGSTVRIKRHVAGGYTTYDIDGTCISRPRLVHWTITHLGQRLNSFLSIRRAKKWVMDGFSARSDLPDARGGVLCEDNCEDEVHV